MHYKQITDGYLWAVGENMGGTEITEAEYNTILETIHNKPIPPDGYDYRLKADLTWEQYKLPEIEQTESARYTESQLQAMTNAELQGVLADMGISATMNKSNMVRLILSMQEGE